MHAVCAKSTAVLDGDSEVRGYCSIASEVVYACINKGGILGRSQVKSLLTNKSLSYLEFGYPERI